MCIQSCLWNGLHKYTQRLQCNHVTDCEHHLLCHLQYNELLVAINKNNYISNRLCKSHEQEMLFSTHTINVLKNDWVFDKLSASVWFIIFLKRKLYILNCDCGCTFEEYHGARYVVNTVTPSLVLLLHFPFWSIHTL